MNINSKNYNTPNKFLELGLFQKMSLGNFLVIKSPGMCTPLLIRHLITFKKYFCDTAAGGRVYAGVHAVLRAYARFPAGERAAGRGGRGPRPGRRPAVGGLAVRHVRRSVHARRPREPCVRPRDAGPVAVQHHPRHHGRVPAAGDRVRTPKRPRSHRRRSHLPDRRAPGRAGAVRATHVVHVYGRRTPIGRGAYTATFYRTRPF